VAPGPADRDRGDGLVTLMYQKIPIFPDQMNVRTLVVANTPGGGDSVDRVASATLWVGSIQEVGPGLENSTWPDGPDMLASIACQRGLMPVRWRGWAR
jgi:hypothetical protein